MRRVPRHRSFLGGSLTFLKDRSRWCPMPPKPVCWMGLFRFPWSRRVWWTANWQASKTLVVVDFLADRFAGVPYWDRCLANGRQSIDP